jgi:hypothetical protein
LVLCFEELRKSDALPVNRHREIHVLLIEGKDLSVGDDLEGVTVEGVIDLIVKEGIKVLLGNKIHDLTTTA